MAKFRPGNPKPAASGRKRGTGNKATAEARDFCRELISDPKYRRRFRERLVKGELSPHIESMAWAYAFGRPRVNLDPIELDDGPDELRITVVDKRTVKKPLKGPSQSSPAHTSADDAE